MDERRQYLVGGAVAGFLFLIGLPILWRVMIVGELVDLRVEAANPLAQGRIVLAFLIWVAVGSTIALATGWFLTRMGAREAAAVPETAAQRAAAPEPATTTSEPAARPARPAAAH